MTSCPRCGAKGFAPCTYTAPRSPWYSEEQLRTWPSMREQFERVGKPMRTRHQERYVVARELTRRAAARDLRERRLAEAKEERRRNPALAIHDAEAAWDREERRRLAWWLARYASVLSEATR
jgi:hypothetical protein